MTLDVLCKHLNDMELLYGDKVILTVTDGESEYHIKKIIGKQCAKHFEPSDHVAEVIITISKE